MQVLVVGRDMDLARHLSDLLKPEGHEVLTVPETENLPDLAKCTQAHLVVYEPLLSGFDKGLDQCQRLCMQSKETLLLIISDAAGLDDKLKAFAAGADDYLAKPFDIRELHARILALLRRHPCAFANPAPHIVTVTPDAELDLRRQILIVKSQGSYLRPLEFRLLSYLVQNPNMVLSREQLVEEVWGYDSACNTRQVDVYICYLRQKIEPAPDEPHYIRTVWGMGYIFTPDGEAR